MIVVMVAITTAYESNSAITQPFVTLTPLARHSMHALNTPIAMRKTTRTIKCIAMYSAVFRSELPLVELSVVRFGFCINHCRLSFFSGPTWTKLHRSNQVAIVFSAAPFIGSNYHFVTHHLLGVD